MVHERDDVVGMDGSILSHPAALEASGHVRGFSDPMVDCLASGKRLRADQLPRQHGKVFKFAGALSGVVMNALRKDAYRLAPEEKMIGPYCENLEAARAAWPEIFEFDFDKKEVTLNHAESAASRVNPL